MASNASSTPVDVQALLAAAAQIELKVINGGIEYWQTWMNQAAKLASIAGEAADEYQKDPGTLSVAARRYAEFGKENADVFYKLSSRLSERYFDEVGRLTESVAKKAKRVSASRAVSRKAARK